MNNLYEVHFLQKELGSGPSPYSYLYFQDFLGSELINGWLVIYMNIKAFNRINRKQLNSPKIFLEYLEFYNVPYWIWFSSKSCLKNYVPRATC